MKRLIILVALYLLAPPVFAQEVTKVFLNEAIEVALKNNIDLQASQYNIEIAKNNIKKANRLQNPEFDMFSFFGGAGKTEPKQIGFSQVIEINKRLARKNLAKSDLELSKKNLAYTKFDLAMDVREAYINLVAVKSILHTLEQQQELQEELLDIANSRATKSSTNTMDAMRAEVALDQMITQVNSAKVEVKKALYNFNKIINSVDNNNYDSKDNIFSEENNFTEMLTPPPNYKFPTIDFFEKTALEKRYDIQLAKQAIEIKEKNLKVILNQKTPDLAISGGYSALSGKYTDSGNYNSGAYLALNLINLPLFYTFKPEIKNAYYEIEQAKLTYQSVENKAKQDIYKAYENFMTAVTNLNYYEQKILENSKTLMNYSLTNYESGKLDITELIVMKQSYKNVIIGYTYALSDYYNSWTNFLREINDEKFIFNELI